MGAGKSAALNPAEKMEEYDLDAAQLEELIALMASLDLTWHEVAFFLLERWKPSHSDGRGEDCDAGGGREAGAEAPPRG
jgi:hypothetical protein